MCRNDPTGEEYRQQMMKALVIGPEVANMRFFGR